MTSKKEERHRCRWQANPLATEQGSPRARGDISRERTEQVELLVVVGYVFLAGLAGMSLDSWTAFFVVLAVLLGLSLYGGDIRMKPGKGGHSA